jgi:hypothetical protein
MTVEWLQMMHKLLCIACSNPCPDENVFELRRHRTLIAEMITERM